MAAATRAFGCAGLDVPVVGQGTWNMEQDGRRAVDALRYGIELGLTHIDTAEIYGNYIDLYLLHWQAPHPVAETVAGFEAGRGGRPAPHRRAGMVIVQT